MASHLLTAHRSFFCFSRALTFKQTLLPNPSLKSYISTFASPKVCYFFKLKYNITSASSDGVPAELVEDSKFVPLNAEDLRYGPPALLLMGFEVEEVAKIQQLLKDLDGEFLEIIFCTEEMINGSLWEAMNTKQHNLEAAKIAKSLPRICILSGLTGEEMMMFIDAFPESGLETPVFAALVPNSADKPVKELIEEIMGDHDMMTTRNQSQNGQGWPQD